MRQGVAPDAPAPGTLPRRLAIVGAGDGTHIGASLRRAAEAAGHAVAFFDAHQASAGLAIIRSLAWRAGRRPPGLATFSAAVIARCAEARPHVLIATGAAPLTSAALRALRAEGIILVNYSTDDPWNPAVCARWHLDALPAYHLVFTPRRANIADFERYGCGATSYLPFGYDEWLFPPAEQRGGQEGPDVLFVGGADRDRAAFMAEFMQLAPSVTLVGGYWERFAATRARAVGLKSAGELSSLTASAKVNLCLVRRANRDGHVMRSLEIGAIGGCMLAERTQEHQDLFGNEGETVLYFSTPREAAVKARQLIEQPVERMRLSSALSARIRRGSHTYADRLATMLRCAASFQCDQPEARELTSR